MNLWKVRQQIYHNLFKNADLGDDLSKEVIVLEWLPEVVIQRAQQYLAQQTTTLYYPGKSFAVAVTYALLLKKFFQVEVVVSLNDPQLLFGNDPYFVPYSQAPDIYKIILQQFPIEALEHPENYSLNFQKTCNYFQLEFLLHADTKVYAPA